jgi:hypothetical protein
MKYSHNNPKKVDAIVLVDDVIIHILQMKKQFSKIRSFFRSPQVQDEWTRNLKQGLLTLLRYISFHE